MATPKQDWHIRVYAHERLAVLVAVEHWNQIIRLPDQVEILSSRAQEADYLYQLRIRPKDRFDFARLVEPVARLIQSGQ